MNGHSYGAWQQNGGTGHFKVCARCGDAVENHRVDEIHAYGPAAVTQPTCSAQGYTAYTCQTCGYVLKNSYTGPNAHDLSYTVNSDGTHTASCNNCTFSETVPHTYVNGVCVCGAVQTLRATFKDYNGDPIQTVSVNYNGVPVYTGGSAALKREATVSTVYEFDKWVQEDDASVLLGPITADTTYVPVYTETARTYTVVFLNWNGDLLATEEAAYGTSAESLAPAATRADGVHTYEFTGWSADITNITKNTYAVAQFEATDVTNFTVTFTDGAGNTLYTTTAADGEAAVYPYDAPAKEGSTFYCWDKDFSRVTADLTVNALFIPESGDMVGVTFVNYDNTLLKADVIAKGGAAVYGLADPEKPEDDENTYAFSGWDNALENVQENTVFTAQFTAVPKHTHTYTFVPEQPAKCGVAGVQAHYSCTCGKVFDTGYNETDLFDLVIPALEHVWGDATY
ncbi:MAG: InlB B-repeat-containing protein, partial [Clostridia bacterium]|nr:InlB B-repeat-containing protein [Clostridia bacterium]